MTKKKNVMSKINLTPSWSSPAAERITSAAGQEAGTAGHTTHSFTHTGLQMATHEWGESWKRNNLALEIRR